MASWKESGRLGAKSRRPARSASVTLIRIASGRRYTSRAKPIQKKCDRHSPRTMSANIWPMPNCSNWKENKMSVVVSAVVVAADAWGTAAFVGAALTAVADVGVATSVIGAVTGNKTMEKVGGALGLVGGVGGLINSGLSTAAVGASDAAGSLGTTGADAAVAGSTDSVVLPAAGAGSATDAS